MDLFIPGYDIFLNEDTRKRAMEIEAIAYRRNKAIENRIKVAKVAIENNDMKTFCEVMHVDTKLFSKELESLPEDERKAALEVARQSAKEQQERLDKIQHEDYLKRHNLKEVYIVKCPICGNLFSSYEKERYNLSAMKVHYRCDNCNKDFYGFEDSDSISLNEGPDYPLFCKPEYIIKKVSL